MSIHEVTNPETGERMYHYEWNGWLWCDRENEAFDFESENPLRAPDKCPHCGDEL